MQLKWKRTVIGGQTAPYDFLAYTDWGTFCRVIKRPFGPSEGRWHWALTCSRSPFHKVPYGDCDSRDEVIDLVKRMFEELRTTNKLEFHRPYSWNDSKIWY